MLGTLLLTLAAGGTGQAADLVLLPDAVLGEDGVLHEGWAVVVRDGRIVSVGEAAEGADGVRLAGVLAAGMVDAYSAWGADGRLSEESRRSTPGLQAADGVDLEADAFEELLARGVTTVHLVPEPSNVTNSSGAAT